MACSVAPSKLSPRTQELTRYAAAAACPFSLKPNPIFFASTQTLPIPPFVLQCGRIENGRLSKSMVVYAASLTADTEVDEEAEQLDDGGGAVVAVATKPKKGKAALPLKRDRV